jgi:predicted DNA-binding protein with PD1-like motif
MIVTQTRIQRRFVGSMSRGNNLLSSLEKICVDNGIFCALLSAHGYIDNPELSIYDPERKSYRTQKCTGSLHAVALQGSVSLSNQKTVIVCHAMGTLVDSNGDTQIVSGELVEGTVRSLEFALVTCDDIRLHRAKDAETGLRPWLHMDLGDPGHGTEAQPVPSSVGPAAQVTPQSTGSLSQVDLKVGDAIEHPQLGTCEVVNTDDDERLSIRLGSGRIVEIHRTLLGVRLVGDHHPTGGRLFAVNIQRQA